MSFTGESQGTMRAATELLKLWPHKNIVVCSLHPQDPLAKINFCNWHLQKVGIFNRSGQVYILEYTGIPKVFFMPHYRQKRYPRSLLWQYVPTMTSVCFCNNAPQQWPVCIVATCSNNNLSSYCCNMFQ
jgi:hypothetical protein